MAFARLPYQIITGAIDAIRAPGGDIIAPACGCATLQQWPTATHHLARL
jgi:hypothetical protein